MIEIPAALSAVAVVHVRQRAADGNGQSQGEDSQSGENEFLHKSLHFGACPCWVCTGFAGSLRQGLDFLPTQTIPQTRGRRAEVIQSVSRGMGVGSATDVSRPDLDFSQCARVLVWSPVYQDFFVPRHDTAYWSRCSICSAHRMIVSLWRNPVRNADQENIRMKNQFLRELRMSLPEPVSNSVCQA